MPGRGRLTAPAPVVVALRARTARFTPPRTVAAGCSKARKWPYALLPPHPYPQLHSRHRPRLVHYLQILRQTIRASLEAQLGGHASLAFPPCCRRRRRRPVAAAAVADATVALGPLPPSSPLVRLLDVSSHAPDRPGARLPTAVSRLRRPPRVPAVQRRRFAEGERAAPVSSAPWTMRAFAQLLRVAMCVPPGCRLRQSTAGQ
jgi:hypothetical protein